MSGILAEIGAPIPVSVPTGFLGSGKTTVLNHPVHSPGISIDKGYPPSRKLGRAPDGDLCSFPRQANPGRPAATSARCRTRTALRGSRRSLMAMQRTSSRSGVRSMEV